MAEDKNYDFLKQEFEKERLSIIEFYTALKFFMESDYDGRVKYMKEHWGEVETKKTIYFGKNSRITIEFGSDRKYHFEFEGDNGDVDEFNKMFPELSEMMKNSSLEEIQKKYPNLKDFSYPNLQDVDINIDKLQADYIKTYNNISYSDKTQDKKQDNINEETNEDK